MKKITSSINHQHDDSGNSNNCTGLFWRCSVFICRRVFAISTVLLLLLVRCTSQLASMLHTHAYPVGLTACSMYLATYLRLLTRGGVVVVVGRIYWEESFLRVGRIEDWRWCKKASIKERQAGRQAVCRSYITLNAQNIIVQKSRKFKHMAWQFTLRLIQQTPECLHHSSNITGIKEIDNARQFILNLV